MNRLSSMNRRINETAGAFIVVTLIVVVVLVVQAARVQRWFVPNERLTVMLPDDGLGGLQVGSEVNLLGTQAGRVVSVRIEPSGFSAEIEIKREFMAFVRSDSEAVIRRRFGVAGDAYLELSRGRGAELSAGQKLRASTDKAPTETIQAVVNELRSEVIPAIRAVSVAATAFTEVADGMRDPDGDFLVSLRNLRDLSEQLEHGQGLAAMLINDAAMARRSDELIKTLHSQVNSLGPTLKNMDRISEELLEITRVLQGEVRSLPGAAGKVQGLLDELTAGVAQARQNLELMPRALRSMGEASEALPSVMLQLQATLREAERAAASVRQSWLLGGDRSPSAGAGRRRMDPLEVAP